MEAGIPADRVIKAAAGQTLTLPGLTLLPLRAAHPTHTVTEAGEDIALCCCLQMDGVTLLHLGDTYLTEQLLGQLLTLPAPDLFFPPVNGSDYFRTARNCIGNLEPLEAARLAALLGADLSMPTHFDMIYGNTADPLRFVQALWQEKPEAKWHIPALGERFIYCNS